MKSFIPTYLYIKQHNVTGLKYFGKTAKKDPVAYKGSGIHWQRHIKLHGNDVTTLWFQLFTDETSIKEFALNFSEVNNIVDSTEWANLKPEDGLEGGSKKGRILSESTRQKLSIAGKGRIVTEETKQKISIAHTGKTRKPFSDEWRANLSKSRKGKSRPPTTEAMKQHLSNLNSSPVYCITNDTIYPSIREAAKALNLKVGNIRHCVHGYQKSTGGFKFSRKKDELQSESQVS